MAKKDPHFPVVMNALAHGQKAALEGLGWYPEVDGTLRLLAASNSASATCAILAGQRSRLVPVLGSAQGETI